MPWGAQYGWECGDTLVRIDEKHLLCCACQDKKQDEYDATQDSQAGELTTFSQQPPLQPKVALSLWALPRPAGQRCSGVTIRTLQREVSGESESPRATGTQMSPYTAGWSQEDLVAQMG